MGDKKFLLTTQQMADFAANGFLRFDEVVPRELNEAVMAEINEKKVPGGGGYKGEPFATLWPDLALGRVFRLPQVEGIINSLVGPNPRYDHHAVHQVGPRTKHAQFYHADAIIDTRLEAFDIQLFYYPHDTPREMGGTMFLPGSQFRRVNEAEIARYQNFLGQYPVVCKAGTILAGHHGLWHCAQPNLTDQMRYMIKLRLNPTVRQVRLWNLDDLKTAQVDGFMNLNHGWYGEEGRIESVLRIKFWRALTGNEWFDSALWLGRLENMPQTVMAER